MQRTTLIKNIHSALAETLDKSEIYFHDQALLRDELGLDSMNSLTFLMALEDKIDGFRVNAENLEEKDLTNIGSVADYVQRELAQA